MKTFNELLSETTEDLRLAGVPEPDLNAWYLMAWSVALSHEDSDDRADEVDFVLRISESMPDRSWLLLHGSDETSEKITSTLSTLVEHRKKRVPLEYITHITEFMGLPIYVDPSVLIPRQDTECVVETALDIMKKEYSEKGADVLDLCTGSGCIAISLAKLGKAKSVTATDKSAEAIGVAKKNAGLNDVNVRFLQGDMWGALTGKENIGRLDADETEAPKFDLIISNPPYIRHDVMPELMEEVRDYEPVMALDGGEDGLLFYRSIVARVGTFLRKGGSLIFEIGYDQGEAVAGLMREAGLVDIEVKKDYAGCDRVVSARLI